MGRWRSVVAGALVVAIPSFALAAATTSQEQTHPAAQAAQKPGPVRKIRGVDADNHLILLNRPDVITLVLGTNENSQDAARAAGKAMYPFQGRRDFQLIVIVDLRDSIATWMPALVLSKMRSNLDDEAIELKPYFLKNGNTSNPRNSSHVIPDFGGTICPQLGWPETSGDLRGILFGVDGREIKRWDKLEDMDALQADVHGAIQNSIDAEEARAAAAAKNQGSKIIQPPTPRPLPPLAPAAPKTE